MRCFLKQNFIVWLVAVCTFENSPSRISPSTIVTNSPDDLGSYVLPENIRNDPMCGWFQFDNADNFDWTRQRGSTPSSKTGPSGDKTTGRGKNIFYYSNLDDFSCFKYFFANIF